MSLGCCVVPSAYFPIDADHSVLVPEHSSPLGLGPTQFAKVSPGGPLPPEVSAHHVPVTVSAFSSPASLSPPLSPLQHAILAESVLVLRSESSGCASLS